MTVRDQVFDLIVQTLNVAEDRHAAVREELSELGWLIDLHGEQAHDHEYGPARTMKKDATVDIEKSIHEASAKLRTEVVAARDAAVTASTDDELRKANSRFVDAQHDFNARVGELRATLFAGPYEDGWRERLVGSAARPWRGVIVDQLFRVWCAATDEPFTGDWLDSEPISRAASFVADVLKLYGETWNPRAELRALIKRMPPEKRASRRGRRAAKKSPAMTSPGIDTI